MRKLDKLILQSFFGPFILTFLVGVFILLLVHMLKYFDDFIGKDLGFGVFGELMFYFSINTVPMALPLAVLVSSLMTYGRLGEHFELTAIKSAGISLIRVLLPTFIFVVILSVSAFFFNDQIVPRANLRAYSLLYDVKQSKPALDLREGQFYDGIPDYSIKVNKKHKDGIAMNDVVIYDHTNVNGNRKVIIADSCRMYTFMDDRYLMMELYEGNYYSEEEEKKTSSKKRKKKKRRTKKDVQIDRFVRNRFDKMDIVFSLASFGMNDTDMNLFAGNRYMKSVQKLGQSIDSMEREKKMAHFKMYNNLAAMYKMHSGGFIEPTNDLMELKMQLARKEKDTVKVNLDSIKLKNPKNKESLKNTSKADSASTKKTAEKSNTKTFKNSTAVNRGMITERQSPRLTSADFNVYLNDKKRKKIKDDSLSIDDSTYFDYRHFFDSMYQISELNLKALSDATSNARGIKSSIASTIGRFAYFQRSINAHTVEKYKKYAQAFACIVMFLIGAPLGAIIKRGGLGVPVIVGVFFYVIFHVLTSASDKWAKGGIVDGLYAAWVANAVLLPPGLIFLKQARKDAKIFDADFYNVWIDRAKQWWANRKKKTKVASAQ